MGKFLYFKSVQNCSKKASNPYLHSLLDRWGWVCCRCWLGFRVRGWLAGFFVWCAISAQWTIFEHPQFQISSKKKRKKISLRTKANKKLHMVLPCIFDLSQFFSSKSFAKGQLNSEWIYEVIVSPKIPTKFFPDFCPTKQTRVVALFLVIFWWV